MQTFRFNVGDTIYLTAGHEEALAGCKTGESRIPIAYTIVAKITEECPGGVQCHYVLNTPSGIIKVDDIEVAGFYRDVPSQAYNDAYDNAKASQDAADHVRWKANMVRKSAAKNAAEGTTE